jgi:hypothetical protein
VYAFTMYQQKQIIWLVYLELKLKSVKSLNFNGFVFPTSYTDVICMTAYNNFIPLQFLLTNLWFVQSVSIASVSIHNNCHLVHPEWLLSMTGNAPCWHWWRSEPGPQTFPVYGHVGTPWLQNPINNKEFISTFFRNLSTYLN